MGRRRDFVTGGTASRRKRVISRETRENRVVVGARLLDPTLPRGDGSRVPSERNPEYEDTDDEWQ